MPLSETVFVQACPTNPETSTPTCFWQEVPSENLIASSSWTPEQMHDATNLVIWLFALIFILAMIKKAIET